MGYVGGELVSGPCEDFGCCGCDPSGTEGCVQPGEAQDKSYWAERSRIEDGDDYPQDFFADDFDEDDEEEDDGPQEPREVNYGPEDLGWDGGLED